MGNIIYIDQTKTCGPKCKILLKGKCPNVGDIIGIMHAILMDENADPEHVKMATNIIELYKDDFQVTVILND